LIRQTSGKNFNYLITGLIGKALNKATLTTMYESC
jgi:hypothetical protein